MVARRAAALVLAAALATGLAACGGGDDDEGSNDEVQLEDVESDANANDDADDDSSDDSGDDEAADEEEATDDTSGDAIEGAFAEGCAEFTNTFGALGAASAGVFDPEAAADFEAFIDDAPEEIRDDLQTLSGFYEDVATAFEDAGIDPQDPTSIDATDPEVLEILTNLSESFSSPEFLEANQAISDFIASGCET